MNILLLFCAIDTRDEGTLTLVYPSSYVPLSEVLYHLKGEQNLKSV